MAQRPHLLARIAGFDRGLILREDEMYFDQSNTWLRHEGFVRPIDYGLCKMVESGGGDLWISRRGMSGKGLRISIEGRRVQDR